MATPPRIFEEGAYYHIYNRGNRKQHIFLEDRDYKRFLDKVLEYKESLPLNIVAYCLMPNHFHFLIKSISPLSVSKFFSNLCNSHSKYFNTKYETVGSLFQGRFKSIKVEEDDYLVHLSRYIHLNPASLLYGVPAIEKLINYKWSSLSQYLSGTKSDLVDSSVVLDYFAKDNSVDDYKMFIAAQINLKQDPLISHLAFNE